MELGEPRRKMLPKSNHSQSRKCTARRCWFALTIAMAVVIFLFCIFLWTRQEGPCISVYETAPYNTKPRVYSAMRGFHDKFSHGGMTCAEQELLAETYASSESIFEWGMGSSTLIAGYVGIKRLTAVDSAAMWVDSVREILNNPAYKLFHADIGPVKRWGKPKDATQKDKWPGYSLIVDNEEKPFDIYLVDGRFRVASACRALLHGHRYSLVLVHDFQREKYQVILEIAYKVTQVGNLVVLRRRPDATETKIKKLWEKYKLIFD